MNFEVKTILSAKTLVDYQRLAGKTVLLKKTLFQRTCLIGIGIIGLTTCAVGMAQAGLNFAVLMGIGLSGIALMMGMRWFEFQTSKLSKRVDEGFEQDFYFTDAGMVAQTVHEKLAHSYDRVYAIAESEEYFCLFLSKRAGYILPKEGFQQGEVAQFGAFIEEKTGKKITHVTI